MIIRLRFRVADLEFEMVALEERLAPVQRDDAPEPPEPIDDDADDEPAAPVPAPAAARKKPAPKAARQARSPAKPRPAPARPAVRPNINMEDPKAVRDELRKVFGVEYTLPAKRNQLIELFNRTFPPAAP